MKRTLVIPIVLLFFLQGCKNEHRTKNLESPLVAIIKMQSAEQLLEFEEAKKYVDVNKVYKDPSNDTTSAEDIWKSMLVSLNNLGESKKFTNQFKYYDYNITESVKKEDAEVVFKSKDKGASIQRIIYKLVLEKENWIVSSIEYEKKE